MSSGVGMMNRTPDILLVVLDCVGQEHLPLPGRPMEDLPYLSRLTRESRVFTHAVAPATWSLPAHSSLFMGLYPWEAGFDSPGPSRSPETTSTIAERCLAGGYQTASFSANPFVSSATGLDRGFTKALWGQFVDCYLRAWPGRLSVGSSRNFGWTLTSLLSDRATRRFRETMVRLVRSGILVAPWALDGFSRLANRANPHGTRGHNHVAPWIEAELAAWVDAASPDRPLFGFVNLLDAHQPYLGLPEGHLPFRDWASLYATSQRSVCLPPGPGGTGRRVERTTRELHRRSLSILDHRLRDIVHFVEHRRDPDNLVVIVTADHGQAFGEDGCFMHGWGPADSVMRVPLLVRAPAGWGWRGTEDRWISTKEVGKLIDWVRRPETAIERNRPNASPETAAGLNFGSAYSICYELPRRDRATRSSRESPAACLVGYTGDTKIISSLPSSGGRPISTRKAAVEPSPPSWTGSSGPILAMERSMHRILSGMAALHRDGVSARLLSWGYE